MTLSRIVIGFKWPPVTVPVRPRRVSMLGVGICNGLHRARLQKLALPVKQRCGTLASWRYFSFLTLTSLK